MPETPNTSDLTLAEFQTLKGKMDAYNSAATTVEEYMDATAGWRTDLYSLGSHGKLVTHAESVALIKAHGRKATPELKTYEQEDGMPTYDEIRQKLVDEYKAANFPASDVWLQSFNLPDVEYWIRLSKVWPISDGARIQPARQPVIAQFLEKVLTNRIRSSSSMTSRKDGARWPP